MLYNSLSFLAFFAVVFAAYWTIRTNRARLALLLASSLGFYAAWYPRYLLLFLFVTALTYGAGIWLARVPTTETRLRRRIVFSAVASDLAILAYFKYAGFLVTTSSTIASWAGIELAQRTIAIVLPLGISFYTFQSIAYIVDVHRGDVAAIRNPLDLALFKAFFPQLIAGPIVRSDELVPQFASTRRPDPTQLTVGLDLVALGLLKKVVVADQVAVFSDKVFSTPEQFSSGVLLLGIYAYAAQIYCDFSGYTDIGRGCAKLLGYDLPLNFTSPYTSVNIVDFWRRWHMSLSRWLRDYLYIPLGGSRHGSARTYANLAATMVLGGLWHGASWTFIAWGAFHGGLLAITRFTHDRFGVSGEVPLVRGRGYRLLATAATFHAVCLGWVLFRAPDFGVVGRILTGIASATSISVADLAAFGWITLGTTALGLGTAFALHAAGRFLAPVDSGWRLGSVLRGVLYAIVVAVVALFSTGGAQQFIYFQF